LITPKTEKKETAMKCIQIKSIAMNLGLLVLLGALAVPLARIDMRGLVDRAVGAPNLPAVSATQAW
jgi:hypothetical protein